jgi:hypothetical protein
MEDVMPRLRLDLDQETFEALANKAFAERPPVPLQAEVILRLALGLPFPFPTSFDAESTPLPANVSGG